MHWTWDEAKNQINQRQHGIRFETAQLVFFDPLASTREDLYPLEQRWQTIGEVSGVIIIVAHSWPEYDSATGEDVGRIISARKAEKSEINDYAEGEF